MTGYHQLDRGAPEAFDDVEVLFTGNPENPIDAFVLQGCDEKIRPLHVRPLLCIRERLEQFHLIAKRRLGKAMMWESLADGGVASERSLNSPGPLKPPAFDRMHSAIPKQERGANGG
jgi:hypothetical protein